MSMPIASQCFGSFPCSRSFLICIWQNSNHAAPATPAPSEPDVQRIGLKLVGMLRNASDKTGRSIAGAFLTLPSPGELPEYYEQIKLPMAIDTIEEKLQAGAYPTVTTVESDVKRMIQNAKDFNMPKSEIFEDAERMRKLAYNYMKVNNPAYKLDPTYSSFPTPVPLEKGKAAGQARTSSEQIRVSNGEDKQIRPTNVLKRSESRSQPKLPLEHSEDAHESETGADEGPDYNFEGKSFQEAQQIIISELLSHADAEYARHIILTSRTRANSFLAASKSSRRLLIFQVGSWRTTTSSSSIRCP